MIRSAAALVDLIRRLPPGATVVAVTDAGADPRYTPVRELAGLAAHGAGGSVLFCVAPARDASPARSRPRLFLPPVNGPEPGRQHTGTRAADLLLAEAREVAAGGPAVGVWLPSRPGPAGVAEAVAATGASLIVVPARSRRRAVLDRTLEYLAARVSAPVVKVAPDGAWAPVSPLGAQDGPGWSAAGRAAAPAAPAAL